MREHDPDKTDHFDAIQWLDHAIALSTVQQTPTVDTHGEREAAFDQTIGQNPDLFASVSSDHIYGSGQSYQHKKYCYDRQRNNLVAFYIERLFDITALDGYVHTKPVGYWIEREIKC